MVRPGDDDELAHRLRRWESLAERRIREGIDAGEYDNLPGRGRPQDLRVNPFVDPATQLGHDLLRGNNVSLPWIERARDIDHDVEEARRELRLAWRMHRSWRGMGEAGRRRETAWRRALERFGEQVDALNARIADHNRTVPVPGMRRARLDAGAEVARAREAAGRR